MARLSDEAFLAQIVAGSEEAVKRGAFLAFQAEASRHDEPGYLRENFVQEITAQLRHYVKDKGTATVRVLLTFDAAD